MLSTLSEATKFMTAKVIEFDIKNKNHQFHPFYYLTLKTMQDDFTGW